MNPERLLQYFERVSEAPDAIPRLRRFILDLAVRGKLVDQDPNDEPAAELLKRIHVEKEQLVEKGNYRRQKPLLEPPEREADVLTPNTWRSARLGAVTNITQGFAFPSESFSSDKSDGLPLIKIGDIGSNNPTVFVRGEYEDTYVVNHGDLLLGLSGSIKCATWKGPLALLNQRIARIVPVPNGLNPQWLLFCVEKCIETWISETSKLTVQNVKAGQLYEAVIPVPPLAEQHRIVAKVDELMPLCDQLEVAKTEREQSRDRLVAASLHRLNAPVDAEEANTPEAFRDHARLYFDHLSRFTTRPEHIKQLRQTILNLAVRGKLVPQDLNDEPVLGTAVLSKPARGHSVIAYKDEEDWLYGVPVNWGWCRLEGIADLVTDGEHATPPRISERQVPLVTAKNVRDGTMDYSITDWVSFETADKAWRRCRPIVGDILLVCVGATTGRLCILREPKDMVLQRFSVE
jgi:type I restriction enzyme S subunit